MTAINSGSHCAYYHAKVGHPENPNQSGTPYEANCEDIIKALDMTFDEGCEFKSLWRRARARQGFVKAESDAVRDATKALHYAGRVLRAEQQKVALVSPGIEATSADSVGREFVSRYDWLSAPSWANWGATDFSGHFFWFADKPFIDNSAAGWNIRGDSKYQSVAGDSQCLDWRNTLEARPQ